MTFKEFMNVQDLIKKITGRAMTQEEINLLDTEELPSQNERELLINSIGNRIMDMNSAWDILSERNPEYLTNLAINTLSNFLVDVEKLNTTIELMDNSINPNLSLSDILTRYEKTIEHDPKMLVEVVRISINIDMFDKTADEVHNEYRFFAEFLNSEEGKKLIPKT